MATENKVINISVSGPGGKPQNVSFEIPSDQILAANTAIAGVGELIVTKCNENEDAKYLTKTEDMVSGDWTVELKKPKLPDKIKNNIPREYTPAPIPPYVRGVNCSTGIGAANLDLSFHCNFVEEIQIKTCLIELTAFLKVHIDQMAKYLIYLVRSAIPFIDTIIKIIDAICNMIEWLLELICIIMALLKCIINTIMQIIALINWILTLGPKVIYRLLSCVMDRSEEHTSELQSH